jgi:hypothetical protein
MNNLNQSEKEYINSILSSVQELGFIDTTKQILLLPKFNVHLNERLPLFLNFINDCENACKKSKKPLFHLVGFFTLYDAFREHAEPSEKPFFVEANPMMLEMYKGKGSAGEPGRFIQPYIYKDVFPYFKYHVIAFGRQKNDPYTKMIPDTDFLRFKGYVDLRKEINHNDIKWEDKKNIMFWRGGIHGFGYKEYDSEGRCQRQMLVDLKFEWLDAKPSYTTSKKEILNYKYQIDIDGEVNAWSGLWWKLYSNSVVFKVNSHYEQWYYNDMKEWEHYIPIKPDLSDIEEKYKWAIENDEKCKQIAENGKKFADQLTYENVINEFVKIK